MLIPCLFDSGSSGPDEGIMPIHLFHRLNSAGHASELIPCNEELAFAGADARPLAWQARGRCELSLLIARGPTLPPLACPMRALVVESTLAETHLPHLVAGLRFMDHHALLPVLSDLVPRPTSNNGTASHVSAAINSFTRDFIQHALPEQDLSHITVEDAPDYVPPPAVMGSTVPLAPVTAAFHDTLTYPNEEEFTPPPPSDAERQTKRDNIARAVACLPNELRTRVATRLEASPFCAATERSEPAKYRFVVERDPNATTPARIVHHRHAAADEDALDRFFAPPNPNWKKLALPPGETVPAGNHVFLVRVQGKEDRPVINCIAGNMLAKSYPSSVDSIERTLRILANPSTPFLTTVDLAKAFRQIAFDDPHQIYAVFYKGDFYAPVRLPMGATCAPYVLDCAMQAWFGPLLQKTCHKYVDNIFLAAATPEQAVDNFLELFDLCEKFHVVINHKDLRIGVRTIPCLGYLVGELDGKHGYRLQESKTLLGFGPLSFRTLRDVQMFLHVARFYGQFCPQLLPALDPFQQLLRGKSQKGSELTKVKLLPMEAAAAHEASKKVVDLCATQLTIQAPKAGWPVIITCDASDLYHAAVGWQHPPQQVGRALEDLDLVPLFVTHGVFTATERTYHVHEKEFHAAHHAVLRFYHLLKGLPLPVRILSDSITVVNKMRPFARGHQAQARLTRIANFLHSVGCTLEHVPGASNLADLASRAAPNELSYATSHVTEVPHTPAPQFRVNATTTRRTAQRKHVSANPLQAQRADTLEQSLLAEHERKEAAQGIVPRRKFLRNLAPTHFSSTEFVQALRAATDTTKPERTKDWLKDGLWLRQVNHHAVYVIPAKAEHLKHALLTLNHYSSLAHQSARILAATIRQKFVWKHLDEDAERFVSKCLVCLTSSDHKLPVQLGTASPPLGPHQVLGMDFADMAIAAPTGERHVLVMVDMYSHRCAFAATEAPTGQFVAAQVTAFAQAGLQWHTLVTDQGSQFANEFLTALNVLQRTNQRLTMANVQFTRGFLESAVRAFKNALRKVTAAHQRGPGAFPSLLGITANIINNTPSIALRGFAPNFLVLGESRLPNALVLVDNVDAPKELPVGFDVLDHCERFGFHVQRARKTMEEHRFPDGLVPRTKPRHLLNEFAAGDYVFRAPAALETAVSPRWTDLSRVVKPTGHRSYLVKSIISGLESECHAARLRSLPGVTEGDVLASRDLILWNVLVTHKIDHVEKLSLEPSVRGGKILTCHMRDIANNPIAKPVKALLPTLLLLFQAALDTELTASKEIESALTELIAQHLEKSETREQ